MIDLEKSQYDTRYLANLRGLIRSFIQSNRTLNYYDSLDFLKTLPKDVRREFWHFMNEIQIELGDNE